MRHLTPRLVIALDAELSFTGHTLKCPALVGVSVLSGCPSPPVRTLLWLQHEPEPPRETRSPLASPARSAQLPLG